VVAEGVEDAEQLGFLVTQRCDLIQGYYFSRPLPAEDFASLLRSGRRLAPDYRLGRAAILVVDDDPLSRGALCAVLEESGFAVSEATRGEEALAVLERQPVNMVIADYFMPGMTGTDLLAKVHQRRPDVVRVLMSGRAEVPMLLEAVNRGAISRFLAKPWAIDDVRTTVEEALGGMSVWRA
jgi:CheY-like chemotaxis protein